MAKTIPHMTSELDRRRLLRVAGTALGAAVLASPWPAIAAPSDRTGARLPDVSKLPKLDDKQIGHIRHIDNLSSLPDGEWSHMGTPDGVQGGLSSMRYQIAHMYYALGLAHFNRLPAAPAVFKNTHLKLMSKMQRNEVWDYWYSISRCGPHFDPSVTKLREPWADPVIKENIMYGGHVTAMAGMFAVLYDDARYDQKDSLVFDYKPYGAIDAGRFSYDLPKLNEIILKQMQETDWLGVPCEPNMVFIVCNQYPLVGFRFQDIRKGTNIAPVAVDGFMKAWQKRDVFTDGRKSLNFVYVKQDKEVGGYGSGAQMGMLLNAWDRDRARKLYIKAIADSLMPGPNGTMSPYATSVLAKVLEANSTGASAAGISDPHYTWTRPIFGYTALGVSEFGMTEHLEAMLAHADRYMAPTWENGGLFYPRNDRSYDEAGNMRYMDPLTGNADIAWARLNVPDGLHNLYQKPWTATHFAKPALTAMSDGIDVLRATRTSDDRALALTMRGRDGASVNAALEIAHAPKGAWALYRDRDLIASGGEGGVAVRGPVAVEQRDGKLLINMALAKETDLVLAWA